VIEYSKLEQRLVEARREADAQMRRTHVLNRFALATTGEHDVERVLGLGLDLVLRLFPYEQGIALLAKSDAQGPPRLFVTASRSVQGMEAIGGGLVGDSRWQLPTSADLPLLPTAFKRSGLGTLPEGLADAVALWDAVFVGDRQKAGSAGDFLALPVGDSKGVPLGRAAYFVLHKYSAHMPFLDRLANAQDYPFLTLLSGHVHAALDNATLLSARNKAEADLARSESRMRRVLERIPTGILIMREGHIDYANAAAAATLGTSPAALAGTSFEALLPPKSEVAEMRLGGIARGDDGTSVHERRLLRRDGTSVAVEQSALSLELDGEPAVISMIRDLTEEKALRARVLQAERLAAVGVLAAGVAHEINNPLAYVLLALERLVAELDGEQAVEAGRALEGTLRIRDVVRDLKTFARDDDERAEPVNVARAMDMALAMAGNEIRHRARVVTHMDRTCHVLASPGRISQVFLNLVINAAHAMAEGGASTHTLTVSIQRSGDAVETSVRDTGRGIPREGLKHLFEPFYTTKRDGNGLGLGLAISRSIVERYAGSIEVESTQHGGTTFRVRLPAAESAESAESPTASLAANLVPRARVLVIDDEPSILAVIRHILRGHEVTVKSSASEAIATLAEGGSFDAILCDLMMPSGGGDVLHAWLVETRPALLQRLAFMTGGAFSVRSQEFVANAGVPVVHKPFNAQEITAAIARLTAGTASDETQVTARS